MNDIAVRCKNIWPGLGIAIITGMAALFLSEHYNAPVMLFALLLGMAVSFLYQKDTPCSCGIDFTASTLLRAGVVLLGLRVALGDLIVLGWQTALMLAGAIFTTIVLGVFLAKAFRGGADKSLLGLLYERFEKVKHLKPAASRVESVETYLLATGYQRSESTK